MVILQYCFVHNLLLTYNTVGLRRISFFSEIRSPQSITNFCPNAPSPPNKKMPPRRSPYRLVCIKNVRIRIYEFVQKLAEKKKKPCWDFNPGPKWLAIISAHFIYTLK